MLVSQFIDARTGVQMMLASKDMCPQPAARLSLVATWAAELRAEMLAENASLRLSRQDALDQVRDHRASIHFLEGEHVDVSRENSVFSTRVVNLMAENRRLVAEHTAMLTVYNEVTTENAEVIDENIRYQARYRSAETELARVRQSLS